MRAAAVYQAPAVPHHTPTRGSLSTPCTVPVWNTRYITNKWGWEFVFLGAGIDAIQAAADIGIAADRAVNFVADSTGIAASFDGVSRAVGNLRARRRLEENEDGTSWRERMDRDFNGRAR